MEQAKFIDVVNVFGALAAVRVTFRFNDDGSIEIGMPIDGTAETERARQLMFDREDQIMAAVRAWAQPGA